MQLTDEQQAFVTACADTEDSICMGAVAGSGKTFILVQGVNAIVEAGPMLSVAALAFNKKIADELATRMANTVVCKTMNALGHRAWIRKIDCKVNLNTRKNVDGFRHLYGRDFVPREEMEDIYKLTSLAKAHGIVPVQVFPNPTSGDFKKDSDFEWAGLVDHFDLAIEEDFIEKAVDMCRHVLTWSINEAMTGHIDFDDQLYMPINFGGHWQKFDVVLIDEAQDISGIQREILRAVLKPGGRLIAVGDPHQAIYGFRGAAHDSMELIASEFNCKPMGLTYSFRCPKAVVNEAKQYVKDIKPAPGAPDGMVASLNIWKAHEIPKDTAIICRNTKPLVDMAFRLIRRNTPCYVLGRDIGFGLTTLIKKMGTNNIDVLEVKLGEYRDRMITKFNRLDKPERAEAMNDKIDTIFILIENIPEDGTIKDLDKLINDMFSGLKNGLCLCTIHKAKGLEWETVYFLDSHLIPSRYAIQPWQIQQEENLAYVGDTRAMQNLIFVTSEGLE